MTCDSHVVWKKFGKYIGPSIKGVAEFFPPIGARQEYHLDRAFWLTAKVETGARYGSVMAYDGTAMTAGLDQHIAVYPKELVGPNDYNNIDDQGTLWKLLRRIECTVPGSVDLQNLWDALKEVGWYLGQDGILRNISTGNPISGKEIRDEFTPMGGVVCSPVYKKQSARWARLFHDLFSNPGTYAAQVGYGVEHMLKRTLRRSEGVVRRKYYVAGIETSSLTNLKISTPSWDSEKDLAMCMYQANSVNAPAIANRSITSVDSNDEDWPKKLIYLLGNNKYGRWDDDIKNGRYQRTRLAARNSGLWPIYLFEGINAVMPKNLTG